MIKVNLVKQKNFPIPPKKIKDTVCKILVERGIVSDSEVSVELVDAKKMADYVAKYYPDDDEPHPVLSFPSGEVRGNFVFPPDGKIHLGEIIINYDNCVEIARREGRLIEEVVLEMAAHGALHLVGVNHD